MLSFPEGNPPYMIWGLQRRTVNTDRKSHDPARQPRDDDDDEVDSNKPKTGLIEIPTQATNSRSLCMTQLMEVYLIERQSVGFSLNGNSSDTGNQAKHARIYGE